MLLRLKIIEIDNLDVVDGTMIDVKKMDVFLFSKIIILCITTISQITNNNK